MFHQKGIIESFKTLESFFQVILLSMNYNDQQVQKVQDFALRETAKFDKKEALRNTFYFERSIIKERSKHLSIKPYEKAI